MKVAYVIFLLFTETIAHGQVERLSLQLDKGFYLSGEHIWFSVGVLNEDTSEIQSKIVYAELVSPENRMMERVKMKIEGRVAAGSITLPVTTDEGYYLIRVFTRYNLNFGEQGILSATFPVYNPLESDVSSFTPSDSAKVTKSWNDGELVLDLSNRRVSRRDTLKLTLTAPENVSVTVSVLDASDQAHTPVSLENTSATSSGRFTVEKSLAIDGILTDLETGERITSPVISVYNGESRSFLRARSEEGRVSIPIFEYTGVSTFQVYNLNPYQQPVNRFDLLEIDYSFSDYYSSEKPVVTKEIGQYILKSKKRRKIHELLGMDLFRAATSSSMDQIEVVPDYSYDMIKYQNIQTLEEFIDEGVFAARVRRKKGETQIRLFNSEDKFTFIDPPWYIVDGIITNDESGVLAIPFKDILQVNLYTKTSTIKNYFEHFLWRNGVIEVITSDVKYRRQFSGEPNVVEFNGFSASPEFFPTLPIATPDLPDVRGVIFWSPQNKVLANEMLDIRIPHSDESGDFVVRAVAISEKGRMYRKEIHYTVGSQ